MSTVDCWTRKVLATLMLPFSVLALWTGYGQISLSVTTLCLHLHLILLELCHCWDLPNLLWIRLNFCGFYKELLLSQGNLTSLFFYSKMQLRLYLAFLKNSVLNLYMYNICWGLTIHTGKNLCFTEFSQKIHWNTRLAASNVFQMFAQSIKLLIPLLYISPKNVIVIPMSEKYRIDNRKMCWRQ